MPARRSRHAGISLLIRKTFPVPVSRIATCCQFRRKSQPTIVRRPLLAQLISVLNQGTYRDRWSLRPHPLSFQVIIVGRILLRLPE